MLEGKMLIRGGEAELKDRIAREVKKIGVRT